MKFLALAVSIACAIAGHCAAQGLTEAEKEFIRQNADAIKDELDIGTSRRGRNEPQIKTKSGNLVLVAADGKEVGYQTAAGETIYFSDLPTRLQTYANSENQFGIDAMKLGYRLGEEAAKTAAQNAEADSVMTYIKDSVTADAADLKENVAALTKDVNKAVSGMNSQAAAVDKKLGTVASIATNAANDAVKDPLKKAQDDIATLKKSLATVADAASKAGKVTDVTKVKCTSDAELGTLGYDTKTGIVSVCHKTKKNGKTVYLMNNVGSQYAEGVPLTSFGTVSKATGCKNIQYTKYSGSNPTGPNTEQYSKMTCKGCSQRPGGMTYTDLVLVGDFTITFHQYDGSHGNGYNMWSFFPENYRGYTHQTLSTWGNQNFWGVYSNPGCKYDVSWDGSQRRESRKHVGRFCDTTRYVSFTRKDGELTLYESRSAPGTNDVSKVMTKRNTWSTKNTSPLRLGMFMHDVNDWIEIYSPGTSVTVAR